MAETNYLILGAGLSGLSASYHIGHNRCIVLEKNRNPFGLVHSEVEDNGFTWDQGPHVSFTRNSYVKELFAESVANEYEEYEVKIGNYFQGYWIDHPAQSNLYQIPEPLRIECLQSFLDTRRNSPSQKDPANYEEWLEAAFGRRFSAVFPGAYTRKYWTAEPKDLTTDWVGQRVFYPDVQDVISGSKGPLPNSTHYITKVRYPTGGGYQSFANILAKGANINLGCRIEQIDLKEKIIRCNNGENYSYRRLISTIPLPVFVRLCKQATSSVIEAANNLCCTQLLLINVEVPHTAGRPENWFYVYDEDKYATRINFTEKMAVNNAPPGWSGIQIEVYFSKYKPLSTDLKDIVKKVLHELLEIGLIDTKIVSDIYELKTKIKWIPWANIVFDHNYKEALDNILSWAEKYGLVREEEDLAPTMDRSKDTSWKLGTITLAGRFGQWKYYWTDDCVLRGMRLSKCHL